MNTLTNKLGLDGAGRYGILFALFWTQTNLVYFLRGFVVRLLGTGIEEYFIPVIFILAAVVCIDVLIRSTRWGDYLFVFLFAAYFYYCLKTMPHNAIYLQEMESQAIYWALPMFFIGLAFNYNQCSKLIYWLSFAAVLLQFYQVMFGSSGIGTNDQGEVEAMGKAYGVLPSALYMIWSAIEYSRPKDIFVAALSFVLILSMGSRGPLACLVIYLLIYFLFFKSYYHPVRSRLIISGLGVVAYLILENLELFLGSIVSSLGLSTRVFDFFSSGDLIAEMGRDTIRENLIDSIQHSPFWGYGLGADRYLGDFYENYAHNLFLELLIDYGPIPGSIIIAFLVLLLFLAIKKSSDYETRMFVIIMMMAGIGSLLFSGSYITSYRFFFTLGVFLAVIRGTKSKLTLD